MVRRARTAENGVHQEGGRPDTSEIANPNLGKGGGGNRLGGILGKGKSKRTTGLGVD